MKKWKMLCSVVLVGFLLLPFPQAFATTINETYGVAWWETVIHNPSGYSVRAHDGLAIAGTYGVPWGSQVFRGVYEFSTPTAIRNLHPGYYVQSATLYLQLDYFYSNYPPYGAPGVHAYNIELTDHTSGGVIQAADFTAPVLSDIGMIVPPEATAGGSYPIDITSALQNAVDHPEYGYHFGVRLQFGSETGTPVDDNLYMEYVFRYPNANPRIEVTLAEIPEPMTLALLGFGGLGLAFRKK